MSQPKYRFARTPLLGHLAQLLSISHAAQHPNQPPADELLDMRRANLSRRTFLQASGLVGAGLLWPHVGRWSPRAQTNTPRIAIVGAGIAGLNAAYQLQKAGLQANVYEAADRVGGRMFTVADVMAPGLTTEFGGEFINSDHEDLLGLVAELGLELFDRETPSETDLSRLDYYFEGRKITSTEIIESFSFFAERLANDFTNLDDNYDAVYPDYDRLSITDYLDAIGMDSLLRKIIETAFTYENGSPASNQSLINFMYLLPAVTADRFEVIGGSDERYKVIGGNQQIPLGLAAALQREVQLNHRLEAVRSTADGYRLSFQSDGGAVEYDADYIIFAIPFTVLRHVDLDLGLPIEYRNAINTLGYGTNAKVMAGMNSRPWRDAGSQGYSVSDENYMGSWDSSQGQAGPAGSITFFAGGMEAMAYVLGTPDDAAFRYLAELEGLYPGLVAAYNGNAARMHWPTYPWTLGSYSSPMPNQYGFYDVMSTPIYNILFAGEHTSADYWGYMNGGAESGRVAAETLLDMLGVES